MLPPIKIKLVDRKHDMSLYSQTPIRIKIKEIKKNNTPNFETPIKIKICDRDANMNSSYEKRKVKVREKNGKILIKYKEDILETDEILEYLSNDYIKPIRIRLSTIDLVYTWLYELFLKFNFSAIIKQQMAIVAMNGKFVVRMLFSDTIFETLTKQFGKPRFILVFHHIIAEALDIFKVEGLSAAFKFKNDISGTTKITQKQLDYGTLVFKSTNVSKSAVYIVEKRTIGDLTTGTIGDQFSDNKTIHDILYKKTAVQEDPDFYT